MEFDARVPDTVEGIYYPVVLPGASVFTGLQRINSFRGHRMPVDVLNHVEPSRLNHTKG